LEVRTAELERERELNAEMAAAAERTRIAREVHDVVAHSVSVMIALSEGAAATPDAGEARGSMRQVASTGRQALTELRGVLAVLQPNRDDRRPTPSVASLEALVQDVRDAGLDVNLRVTGDVHDVSAGLQTTVYRLVQESLTNTLKHAPGATHSSVAVGVTPDEVKVVVRDNGRAVPASNEPGHGLRGMRQRVEVYGGQVTAGHDGACGWVVTGTVPRNGGGLA
jgi:signal transduction histidine kinase